jgi:hypothetical protein
MSGACRRNFFKILVLNLEVKRLPGRPGRKQVNNIKMDLTEIRYGVWTRFIWFRIGRGGGFLTS